MKLKNILDFSLGTLYLLFDISTGNKIRRSEKKETRRENDNFENINAFLDILIYFHAQVKDRKARRILFNQYLSDPIQIFTKESIASKELVIS